MKVGVNEFIAFLLVKRLMFKKTSLREDLRTGDAC